MGKGKGRSDEHACRVNYLFQAGQLMAKTSPYLSEYYGKVLNVVTEKTANKQDYTMKRSICRKCQTILSFGVNASYRLRKNKHHKNAPYMVIGCNECGQRKRIPATRGYKLKAEAEGRLIESSRRITPVNLPPTMASCTVSDLDNMLPDQPDTSCPVAIREFRTLQNNEKKHDFGVQEATESHTNS